MPIIQPVNQSDFIAAFHRMGRGDQFSHAALLALFDHLDGLSDEAGEPLELDVIALCCEYEELTLRQAIANYSIAVDDDDGDDEKAARALEYLEERTSVIRVYDDCTGLDSVIVIAQF